MGGKARTSFDPQKEMPSLEGKVIIVTGGTAGLGKQSVLELARHKPAQLWLAARNASKAQSTVDEIKKLVPGASIQILQMDLSSLQSVREAATRFLASSDRLDVLLNNAGIMAHPAAQTRDGYELQFGSNFLGHALLVRLLLPTLQATAARQGRPGAVRVVCMSSGSHARGPPQGIVFDTLKNDGRAISDMERYGQSKLANILYAKELASRHPDLTIVAVNPGMVRTGLTSVMAQNNLFYRAALAVMSPLTGLPVSEGVKPQLWASTGDDVQSGEYYSRFETGKGSAHTKDSKLASQLWEWTQRELDEFQARSA